MADTGADFNCISLELCSLLHLKSKIIHGKPLVLNGSGTQMDIPGGLSEPLMLSFLDSDNTAHIFEIADCIVVKNLPYPIILGNPFWHTQNISINVRQRYFSTPDGQLFLASNSNKQPNICETSINPISDLFNTNENCSVVSHEDIILESGESMIIKVFLPFMTTKDIYYFEPNLILENDEGIISAPGILNLKEPYIVITNVNLEPIEVLRTHILGTAIRYRKSKVVVTNNENTLCVIPLNKECMLLISGPNELIHQSINEEKPVKMPALGKNMPPNWKNNFNELLINFTDVFINDFHGEPWSGGFHEITVPLDTKPFAMRPYRIPEVHLQAMKDLMNKWIKENVIRPSKSPWASPAFMVPKHDGGLRMVVDYRQLNLHTIPDPWPLPTTESLFSELHNAVHFLKI